MKQTPGSDSANHTRWVDRVTWALLILCSVGLLGSSVYRAATLPFNHDESVSFAIFTWNPSWRDTANHHLLNTVLMHWCSILFGNSEISLRLPNLLAHGVYLLCALALVKRAQDPILQIAGFALFNLNLFLVEYFFVARGYGLALAFEMLSLYLFVRAYEEKAQRRLERDLYLSVAAGSLAVLSNLSFLNYFLPLLVACGWLLLTDGSLRRFSRRHTAATLPLLLASGVFLFGILLKVLKLQRDRQLYLGGHDSFIGDTVHSLVRCSLHSAVYSPATARTVSTILIAVFFLLLVLGLRQLVSATKDAMFGVLVLMLASAAALPILEQRLFDTLFPVERAALYYLPLYAVVLLSALRMVPSVSRRSWWRPVALTLSTAIAVTLGWYFYSGFSVRSSCAWWQDSHNREVLERISRDHAQSSPARTVKLRASWVMEPSLNFYRVTRHYTWLMPVTREPITRFDADYIYAYESELDTLLVDRDMRLASYPDIRTVLVRVNHAGEP